MQTICYSHVPIPFECGGKCADMSEECSNWDRIRGKQDTHALRNIVVTAVCWNLRKERNSRIFNEKSHTIGGWCSHDISWYFVLGISALWQGASVFVGRWWLLSRQQPSNGVQEVWRCSTGEVIIMKLIYCAIFYYIVGWIWL